MEENILHAAILDTIPDIAWLKDEQGKFLSVNEPFGRACGLKPKDLIGKTDLDIWPKELAESYRADDLEVMSSKKRKYVQERLSDNEGKIKWLETIKTPVFDDSGKVIGTVGIARDITERKENDERLRDIRAELEIRVKVRTVELTRINEELRKEMSDRLKTEQALAESEKKFRDIFDDNRDGMLLVDVKTLKFEIWNNALLKMLGYTGDEMSGLSVPDIHPENELANVKDKIKRQIAQEITLAEGIKVKRKDGLIIYVDISSTPISHGGKKYLLGSFRDITQRKEIEQELQVYRNKLEMLVDERTKELEAEINIRKAAQIQERSLSKQIEFILGATKTGLDIIDENFYIRYIDPEWAKKYGNAQGKKCFDYFMSRKSPCPECALKKVFATKQIVVSYEVLAKENNRPIQVTSIPFQDENGEWLVAEINADMTEKKKIDDKLEQYRLQLEDEVAKRTKELIQEVSLHKKAEVEKSKLNRNLLKFNEKLKSVSLIDAHTGLYNHRYLYDVIESEFHQARRYAQSLSVIMVDIDYFKSINDVYGVTFGDLVLKQLAKQLKRMVRRYDILIRYSGEEFVIISPRLSRNLSLNMAQRLLESLNFINFGNKEHVVKLKLSLAAVSFPEDRANKGVELINLANDILNKAKEGGGNRAYSSQDIKKQPKRIANKSLKNKEVESLKNTINKLNKKSKQGLVESIFAFAKTIELKDHYTGEHVENTVHYATEIAKKLDLPREDLELIKQAAMLHDLGKIGISENILLKRGKLNKKEFAEIRKHPQIGADIIRPIQFLHSLVPLIFYHHERWDGKGYPSGIKGEDIPIGARIIAIADVYQALTSDRPYRKAFSKKKATEIIKTSAGTQFDPRIANIFLKVISKEK